MACRQELLACQIAGDLGHKRFWNLGEKKEDDERVPFYLLLAPVRHRGGQNRCAKKWRRAQAMADRPTSAATAIKTKP